VTGITASACCAIVRVKQIPLFNVKEHIKLHHFIFETVKIIPNHFVEMAVRHTVAGTNGKGREKSGRHRALIFFVLIVVLPWSLAAQVMPTPQDSALFRETVLRADQYYDEGKYDNAFYDYQNAAKIIAGDRHVNERIQKLRNLIDDQKTKNILFEAAITSAEQWFKAGDYKRAKTEYENALKIDPTAQYPKDRLAQISKIWSDPEVDAAYAAAILHADDLYAAKKYSDAKAEYMTASDLKPHEQYPLDRIMQINEILAKQKELQEHYDRLVGKADSLFNIKVYEDARKTYMEALGVKPEEHYPKNRISEIDGILASLQRRQSNYDSVISVADNFYIDKQYDKAKSEYRKAAAMKPDERYPQSMIDKIDPIMADAKAKEEAYTGALKEGDAAFSKQDYTDALIHYQQAAGIKPAEQYPRDKIAEINRLNTQAQAQQNDYDKAISTGDYLLEQKEYNGALVEYQKAAKIKPDENYPGEKISLVNAILADLQAKHNAYKAAIVTADSLFSRKEYDNARKNYEAALTYKPGEKYPSNRLITIDSIQADITEQQKVFNEAIGLADDYYAKKNYTKALEFYKKALIINRGDPYPAQRIITINQIFADQQARQQDYEKAIATADSLYLAAAYPEARNAYQQALSIIPGQQYPKKKVDEIDKILGDLAVRQKAYNQAVASGDSCMTLKDYPNATRFYQEAIKAMPSEEYPHIKINNINELLAVLKEQEETYRNAIANGDKLFQVKDYENARNEYITASGIKPEVVYARDRITEINKILSQMKAEQNSYDATLKDADRLFGQKEYDQASARYADASAIKPEEQYPKDRIAEINRLLADMKSQHEAYDRAITAADNYFNSGVYDKSLSSYREAAAIKPEEPYPLQKINEINKLLADAAASEEAYNNAIVKGDAAFKSKDYLSALTEYQNARNIKPDETYPVQKTNEINTLLAVMKKDKDYSAAIQAADDALNRKQYQDALDGYNKALEIKPGEKYPQDRITEINKIIAGLAAKDKAYQQAIVQGDSQFDAKDYEKAVTSYQNALNIKPAEEYPAKRMEEARNLLAAAKVQKAYDEAVTAADKAFNLKDYDNARTDYQNALNIKPGETYPQQKINEINTILAEDAKQRDEAYNKAITMGDQYFTQENYRNAKVQYQNAIGIKPDEEYPRTKLKQTEELLLAREMAMKAEYEKAIAKADNLYNQKILDEALTAYQAALDIKPDEAYPANQIRNIKRYIEEHAIVNITGTTVVIKSNTEVKYDFTPVDIRSRKNNYIVIKARCVSDTSPRLFLSYGAGARKNGGVVLKAIQQGDTGDYIIRVSAQDPWYRYDNDWLKLYSEGGDTEIGSIQISSGE